MALTKPDHRMSKLLATVSSDLSGGVIERGSNANGEYVKFADGTMICRFLKAAESTAMTTPYGNVFITASPQTWNYPATFFDFPHVHVTPRNGGGGTVFTTINNTTTASAGFYTLHPTSLTRDLAMSHLAIGRWY